MVMTGAIVTDALPPELSLQKRHHFQEGAPPLVSILPLLSFHKLRVLPERTSVLRFETSCQPVLTKSTQVC